MELACLDGAVVPLAEARIPVTDAGLLRGDGAFEVVRLYGGRPYALNAHLARLARTAGALRLPLDADRVAADVAALLAAAAPGDAVVRIVLTRGGRRLVLLEPLPDRSGALALSVVEYVPTRVLDGTKSLSYAANVLADRLAHERGADAALLASPHGRVLEGATSSFFVVLGGRLRTPPLSDRVLDSITRRVVLAETAAQEAVVTLDDVRKASGAFLASTTREVQPVARIDDVALDPGDPVVAAAATATRAAIAAALG